MKKRIVLMLWGRNGALWVKVSFTEGLCSGFEVYGEKPSEAYWRDGYGHGPPPLLSVPTGSDLFIKCDATLGSRYLRMLSRTHDFAAVELVGEGVKDATLYYYNLAMRVP